MGLASQLGTEPTNLAEPCIKVCMLHAQLSRDACITAPQIHARPRLVWQGFPHACRQDRRRTGPAIRPPTPSAFPSPTHTQASPAAHEPTHPHATLTDRFRRSSSLRGCVSWTPKHSHCCSKRESPVAGPDTLPPNVQACGRQHPDRHATAITPHPKHQKAQCSGVEEFQQMGIATPNR